MFAAEGLCDRGQVDSPRPSSGHVPCRKAWQMATRAGSCSYGHSVPARPSQRPWRQKCQQSTRPLAARAASAMRCRLKSTDVAALAACAALLPGSLRLRPIPLAVASKPLPGTETCRVPVLLTTTRRRLALLLLLLLHVLEPSAGS